MPLQFQCSKCTQLIKAEAEHFGKVVKCPACGRKFDIPRSVPGELRESTRDKAPKRYGA